MYRKPITFLDLFKLLFVGSLSLILLIVLNFTSDFSLVKSILSLIIIFFLPGYSLVNILYEKKLSIPDIFILSIGISISIFILIAMVVNLAGIRINTINVLNSIAIANLILGELDFLKNTEWKHERK
jgi:uncharacterized membrane protein